ncbi:NDP-sugar synthase [Candidatus Peregrinibacteria bacterium]|nr:MAG: NDP-sugar synthase [Candidatus Peregrinibacteria bacterium]
MIKCIILAGGFATRLWPLTENKAKPLLHLKDRPMISHIVEGLPKHLPIVISTNAAFENDFKIWAQGYPDRSIQVFVEDSQDDQGKKGALAATAMVIEAFAMHEDLLLIAGDNYFGFKLTEFIDQFQNRPLLAAYDIQQLTAAKKFGVVVEREGRVIEFQEKPAEPKSTLVSTGCYLFPQRNLRDIVEYSKTHHDNLGGIFEHLLTVEDRIDVFSFREHWYDVGSFEGYINANKELLNQAVVRAGTVLETGSNELIGSVYLGDHSRIENCVIEDSVILGGNKLVNCVIRHCIIDENCQLNGVDLSHKMIRQGSHILK